MTLRSLMHGMPLVVSRFVPEFVDVPVAPLNKRDARKRAVIAARRRRAHKAVPQYTKRVCVAYLVMNNGQTTIFHGSSSMLTPTEPRG